MTQLFSFVFCRTSITQNVLNKLSCHLFEDPALSSMVGRLTTIKFRCRHRSRGFSARLERGLNSFCHPAVSTLGLTRKTRPNLTLLLKTSLDVVHLSPLISQSKICGISGVVPKSCIQSAIHWHRHPHDVYIVVMETYGPWALALNYGCNLCKRAS